MMNGKFTVSMIKRSSVLVLLLSVNLVKIGNVFCMYISLLNIPGANAAKVSIKTM